MSKEFLYHVRYALDKVAQDAFEAACLKIEEEMKSLDEVRARFGSLDNYHVPDETAFRLNLRLREERVTMRPTYYGIDRLIGDEVFSWLFYANFATGIGHSTRIANFCGKPFSRNLPVDNGDFEDEDFLYPAPGHDVCYRDEEGVFHTLRRGREQRYVIYNDDTPYLVTAHDNMIRPILTADEKRQIVRCMNLWTKEQKVYVFPCPEAQNSPLPYLSYFFMFANELHAFGEGKKIYHIPSNRLVAELGDEIVMDNVRAVASDGHRLVVSQYNRRGDTELLRYDLSR